MSLYGRVLLAWHSFLRRPLRLFLTFGLNLLPRIRYLLGARYRYQQLTSPNQLRVLQLHPTLSSLPEEPIRCTLKTVTLDEYTSEYREWSNNARRDLSSRQRINEWQREITEKRKEKPKTPNNRFAWGDYVAISYTWGSTNLSNSIILDGHFFSVPKSVVLALQSIRSAFPKSGSACSFWLDFVCINQQDSNDKTEQVMRMQNIFGEAISIFVHLGEADEETELAMNLINRVTASACQAFDYKQYFAVSLVQHSQGVPFADKAAYMAVFKLFAHPYWRRMWIIQELVMADDLSIVLCGNSMTTLCGVRLTMKLVVENMAALRNLVWVEKSAYSSAEVSNATGVLWWVERLRQHARRWQQSEAFTYHELRSPALYLAQTSLATYRYDKVFGMLGILPKEISSAMEKLLVELPALNERMASCELDDRGRREIEDEFVKRVFVTFVKTIMQTTNDLDIIYARNTFQEEHSQLDLPSWVTDWTVKPDKTAITTSHEWHFSLDNNVLEFLGAKEENALLTSEEYVRVTDSMRADAGRKGKIQFSSDNKHLHCQGFLIGCVENVAPEAYTLKDEQQPPEMFRKELMAQSQGVSSPYGNDNDTGLAILRTLLFDSTNEASAQSAIMSIPWFGEEATEDAASGEFNWGERSEQIVTELVEKGWDPTIFAGPFSFFEVMRRRLGHFKFGGKLFKDYFPSEITTCQQRPSDKELNVIFANIQVRRLATINTGHFALAPTIVQPGDEIFILLGCSCPVILRLDQNHQGYKVVGECYVEGFMQGEAMDDIDSKYGGPLEITLC